MRVKLLIINKYSSFFVFKKIKLFKQYSKRKKTITIIIENYK